MNKQQIEEILANAPEGATHYCNGDYYCLEIKYTPITEHYKWFIANNGGKQWDDVGDMYVTELSDIQSLADLRQILELMERVVELESRVVTIDTAALEKILTVEAEEPTEKLKEIMSNLPMSRLDPNETIDRLKAKITLLEADKKNMQTDVENACKRIAELEQALADAMTTINQLQRGYDNSKPISDLSDDYASRGDENE